MSLIKIPTKNLSEKGWQELRQSFVDKGMTGGSDAGAMLGWNQYKSPLSMYYQAIGIKKYENITNIEMLMGKMQEDNIAFGWQFYDEDDAVFAHNYLTKNKVRLYKSEKNIVINPKYPTLFANLDGIITRHPIMGKKKGILEIKKINKQVIDMYVDRKPPQYVAQAQQYMMVMEFDYAELCMRVDGNKYVVHLIEKDEAIQQAILTQSLAHQERVLKAKELLAIADGDIEDMYSIAAQYEPDADATGDFKDFITEKHKERANEKSIIGEPIHDKWINQYLKANATIKDAEKAKLLWGNKIRQFLEKKGASLLDTDENRVAWRSQFKVTKKF